MQLRRISTQAELDALAGPWNRLSGGVPFRSHAWLSNWWRHYQPALAASRRDVELFVLTVWQDEQLVAVAPWYLQRAASTGRVIRFLGSGEVCSDFQSLLCEPESAAVVAAVIADWLAQASRGPRTSPDRWDILELNGVEAHDAPIRQLAQEMTIRGAGVHARHGESTWRIALPSRWPEYLATVSKSHRKQLRQAERRLFALDRARLHTVSNTAELETAWQILTQLHQRRMHSLGRPGSFSSPAFCDFHYAASSALLASGALRMHWLEVDGRPIAAEYHLAGRGIVYAYQGGIEPQALPLEPGRLITLATLEQAIAQGYSAFDFCRGDENYKAHWRAEGRPSLTWRIVCRRPTARLRQQVWSARQTARGLMCLLRDAGAPLAPTPAAQA